MKMIGKRRLFQVTISDGKGKIVWFNGLSWIIEKFNINDEIAALWKNRILQWFKNCSS